MSAQHSTAQRSPSHTHAACCLCAQPPGAKQSRVPLAPSLSEEDKQVVDNVVKIVNFLTKGSLSGTGPDPGLLLELLPVLPTVAREVLPQVREARARPACMGIELLLAAVAPASMY